jgi:hypothetical protein
MTPFSKPEHVSIAATWPTSTVLVPDLIYSLLDTLYYGIIRSNNNTIPQLESRDIHPTHMTPSVIPSLMADEHCDVDTRSQYAEMLMSVSRTQEQARNAFGRLLTVPIFCLQSFVVS